MANIIPYPGSPIRAGNSVAILIDQIQIALESSGIGGLTRGQFDSAMVSAVKLFQNRQVDQAGVPLKVDGIVGRFTWTALFGSPSTQASGLIAALPAQVLSVAITQIGVMENKGQPNRGPQVDAFLKVAGIGNPQRFFDHLAALGVQAHARAFADHYHYQPGDLKLPGAEIVVMTEKDAVKCAAFADGRMWFLRVEASLPAEFDDFLLTRLAHARRSADGPQAA